jgi:hypothetical protein
LSRPNPQLRAGIAWLLASGPMTIAETAQRLGCSYQAASACIAGMRNRREVVTLKPKDASKPYRFRLREGQA